MTVTPKRLGEMCVEAGLLDAARVDAALQVQQGTGERIGRVLVRTGALPEAAVVRLLGQQLGLRSVDADSVRVHPLVLQQVPAAVAHRLKVLPVGVLPEAGRQVLFVATADPRNAAALQALETLLGTPVRPVVAGEDALRRAVERHYGSAVEPPPPMAEPQPITAPAVATAPPPPSAAPGLSFPLPGPGPGLFSLDAQRPGAQAPRKEYPPAAARIPLPHHAPPPHAPPPPAPTAAPYMPPPAPMAAPPIPPHQTPPVPPQVSPAGGAPATTNSAAWRSLMAQQAAVAAPARSATPPPVTSPRTPPPHAAPAPPPPRAQQAVTAIALDELGPEDITADGPMLVGAHDFLADANAVAIGLEEVDPNAPPEQPVNAVGLVATSMAPPDEDANEEFNPDLIERGPPSSMTGAWTREDSPAGLDASLADDGGALELASAHEFMDLAAQAARAPAADDDPDITLDSGLELDTTPRFSLPTPPPPTPPAVPAAAARTLEMPALTPVPSDETPGLMDSGALPTEERAMPDFANLDDGVAPRWLAQPGAVTQKPTPARVQDADGLDIPPLTPWSNGAVQTNAADVVTLKVDVAPQQTAGAPPVPGPTIDMLRALIVQGLVEDALVETFVLKGLVSREEVDRLKAMRK